MSNLKRFTVVLNIVAIVISLVALWLSYQTNQRLDQLGEFAMGRYDSLPLRPPASPRVPPSTCCAIPPVQVVVEQDSSVWEAAAAVYGHRGDKFLVRVYTTLQEQLDVDAKWSPVHNVNIVPPGFRFLIFYDGQSYPVYEMTQAT